MAPERSARSHRLTQPQQLSRHRGMKEPQAFDDTPTSIPYAISGSPPVSTTAAAKGQSSSFPASVRSSIDSFNHDFVVKTSSVDSDASITTFRTAVDMNLPPKPFIPTGLPANDPIIERLEMISASFARLFNEQEAKIKLSKDHIEMLEQLCVENKEMLGLRRDIEKYDNSCFFCKELAWNPHIFTLSLDYHNIVILEYRIMPSRKTSSPSKSPKVTRRRRAPHVPHSMLLRKRNRSPNPQAVATSSVGSVDETSLSPARVPSTDPVANRTPAEASIPGSLARTQTGSVLNRSPSASAGPSLILARSSTPEPLTDMNFSRAYIPAINVFGQNWDNTQPPTSALLTEVNAALAGASTSGPSTLTQNSVLTSGPSAGVILGLVPARSSTPDPITSTSYDRTSAPMPIQPQISKTFEYEVSQYEARTRRRYYKPNPILHRRS
ncbi:hypothetical protein F5880DRAFT_1618962 [Lentinula raphanica]|nr:hypothetical protein F5880DRAFT_1618962 [Lentinula raphanica]